ncbi:hypothetical protein SLS55_002273 [Diplodia seriata]|uniref:NADP-dependent oxidoreductase domain-containing protein n=1 Tax=Diplodia seriata TaxID=420778 RepID=A0ABR3CRQ3_9PEZI
MTLPTRQLGKDGPEVTGLGLGLMGLSIAYGVPKPDPERMAFLDKAYELGERNWDTADMYGDNEDLLGRWFAANPGARRNIFLATKFGNRIDADGNRSIDSSPAYCKEAFARSLSRLGLPSVDLYYCHRLDGVTPIELTVRAMAELQAEGKVRHLGLSECSAASLRRASKVARIAAVQIEYSPFALDVESEQVGLLRACRELGVAVVAYSPLGRGMLSGALRSPADFAEGDFRRQLMPRFSDENFPKNLALVDRIEGIARKKGVTSTQLTLAWLMRQGRDIIPIPGTTRVDRLQENLKALEVELTEEEDREIREASEGAEVAGERYPEAFMKACFADTPPLEG